tara:strand:- start:196818 stop:198515 length:1698 start_codon:yes stop_codon:yes gene_type:complete
MTPLFDITGANALPPETLFLVALGLALTLAIGLVIGIWRGIIARRTIRSMDEQLRTGEQELQTLIDSNQSLIGEVHQKDLHGATLGSDVSNLRARLEERDALLRRAEQEQKHLADTHNQVRDELSRTVAQARGVSAELEQVRQQLQQKVEELQSTRTDAARLQQEHNALLNDHTQLRTELSEREDQHTEKLELLNDARDNLKKEFENLANRIFEDKGKHFTSTSRASLESLLQPFREQITGFQTRINEVHSESIKGNTALESEIKKVLEIGLEMNTQATNLTSALKGDKKTTGNWGEAQLQRTLEMAGLQAGEHYDTQAAFKDDDGKRKLPDFIIKLPDGKHLVIDSKVSLVDYDRAIAADTEEDTSKALTAHAQAVRNHIDDLANKDYANLPNLGSPDFVLMFMPVEPAYIEAMKHNKELFNYGYQKGVIMVSHTTLMPILRTVANLWMIDRSNKEAREISGRAGEIYNQVCLVAERLHKLGNTLKAANNHYNDTVKGLVGKQGLHGKIERFQQLSTKANKSMPALEPIHGDIENERLETTALPEETPHDHQVPGSNIKPIKAD